LAVDGVLSVDLAESDSVLVPVELGSLDLASVFEVDLVLDVDFGVSLMVFSNLDILNNLQPVCYTIARADARTSNI